MMLNFRMISLAFLTLVLCGNFINAQIIVDPTPAPVIITPTVNPTPAPVIVTPTVNPTPAPVIVTPTVNPNPSTVIVTPLPAVPKAVIVEPPTGYIECKEMPAQWIAGIWQAGYKVCRYNTDNALYKGEAWVSGHWSCTQYEIINAQATCAHWDWVVGGWVSNYSTIEVR